MDAGFDNPVFSEKRSFLGSLYVISTVSFGWKGTRDRNQIRNGKSELCSGQAPGVESINSW